MAGHCSTHTRGSPNPMGNESFRPQGLPAAQGASATSRMPPAMAVVPYPSSFPFIHPLTNQVMMMRPPPCFLLPRPSMPFWMTAAQHQIQAPPQGPLICDTVVHSYTVMSWPCHAATAAVVPSPRHAFPANQPGAVQADLTLRLGSGSGGNSYGDNKRQLMMPELEDGRHGKRAVVATMDDADQSGEEGNDADGLDLELRLCR